MIWNYFKNKKRKIEALKMARRACRDMLDSFKESREAGHPCPDYGYRRSLEQNALRYAKLALQEHKFLTTSALSAMNYIVDYDRLKNSKLPIPMEMLKNEMQIAYDTLKGIK